MCFQVQQVGNFRRSKLPPMFWLWERKGSKGQKSEWRGMSASWDEVRDKKWGLWRKRNEWGWGGVLREDEWLWKTTAKSRGEDKQRWMREGDARRLAGWLERDMAAPEAHIHHLSAQLIRNVDVWEDRTDWSKRRIAWDQKSSKQRREDWKRARKQNPAH